MAWKRLSDLDLAGKRVLTRVDINVPVEDGVVTDTTRIDRIVPTVRHILDAGGTIRQLTAEQRQEWVDVMKPVWDKFSKDVGQENIDAAQAINAAM